MIKNKIYILLLLFVVILTCVSCKSVNENEESINNKTISKTLFDNEYLTQIIELCYFEGESYAGFNTYPLSLSPNLRIIHDVVELSNMGYYELLESDKESILLYLNEIDRKSFNDDYLYYKIMIRIGEHSDNELIEFLEDHYNIDKQLFFADNRDENLMDSLTATLNAAELCNLTNINIPNVKEVKGTLIEQLENVNLFLEATNIQECYYEILSESGTILRTIALLDKTDEYTERVMELKKWFHNILNIVLASKATYDNPLEIWIRNDITEINNRFFKLNTSDFNDYLKSLFEQITYYNIGFNKEVYLNDSQYVYELAKLSSNYENNGVFINFVNNYIKHNIKTQFRQQEQTVLIPEDTYFGVSIAKDLNISIMDSKIEFKAYNWIEEFNNDKVSSVESNLKALYGLKILKLLGSVLSDELSSIIEENIYEKITSTKYANIIDNNKYLALHEISILLDIQSEVDENKTSELINNLPSWIDQIKDDDLAITNFNIAQDLINVLDLKDSKSKKYIESISIEVDKKIKDLNMISDNNSNSIIQEWYQITTLMHHIGKQSNKQALTELLNNHRYTDDLITAFYRLQLEKVVAGVGF